LAKKNKSKDEQKLAMYKEFGQIPIPVLKDKHPNSKICSNFYDSFESLKETVK
jgi:hypothetical protein